jgi:hypothetical protein
MACDVLFVSYPPRCKFFEHKQPPKSQNGVGKGACDLPRRPKGATNVMINTAIKVIAGLIESGAIKSSESTRREENVLIRDFLEFASVGWKRIDINRVASYANSLTAMSNENIETFVKLCGYSCRFVYADITAQRSVKILNG